jgi:transcriptional regulator GlxA family with amidase domain
MRDPMSSAPPPRRPTPAIARTIEFIGMHFADRISLQDLAAIAGLSVFRFVTVFRQQMGISPHRYLCRVRVSRAQALLREGVPTAIVATEVGFFDQSHLGRHFKSQCGLTPRQYLTAAITASEPAAPGMFR